MAAVVLLDADLLKLIEEVDHPVAVDLQQFRTDSSITCNAHTVLHSNSIEGMKD